MSYDLHFPATGTQKLPDTGSPNQMIAARMMPPLSGTAPWAADIYDGTDATGRLVWQMASGVNTLSDSSVLGADGIEFTSGNVFVNFTSGSGQNVFLIVK